MRSPQGAGGGDDVTFNAGSGLTISHATYGSITLTEAAATTAGDYADAMYAEDGELSFQVGYDAGQVATTNIRSVKATDLGSTAALASIDVSTVEGANTALGIIDEAINQVSTLRGDSRRLPGERAGGGARSLGRRAGEPLRSESAIRDTDFGREMAEFTTTQVLVQSATSFLSQANSLPQNVLQPHRG